MTYYNKYTLYDNYGTDDGWYIGPTWSWDSYILCEVVTQWDCKKLRLCNLIPRENTKINAKRYNEETNW